MQVELGGNRKIVFHVGERREVGIGHGWFLLS